MNMACAMFQSRIVVVLLVHAMCSGSVTKGNTIELYKQPTADVSMKDRVFVNPSPWPKAPLANSTCSVMWQRNHSDAVVVTPYAPSMMAWTGNDGRPNEQAASSHPTSLAEPWSGVQFSNGIWGAALNTSGAYEHLSTTTIESAFDLGCVDIWTEANTGLLVEMELEVPFAFKEEPINSCAIYVSISVYLKSKPKLDHFIWYSTPLFDLNRDIIQDHVFIDTVSQKLIVSGPVSGKSSYNKQTPTSATSSNTTWTGLRKFSYLIEAKHVEQGIKDGVATYPKHMPPGFPTLAKDWCVPGFNVELEGTPGAGAGLSLKGLTISKVDVNDFKQTQESE